MDAVEQNKWPLTEQTVSVYTRGRRKGAALRSTTKIKVTRKRTPSLADP